MPSPAAPDVSQVGFSTGGGALANIVDSDIATYWQPLADGLDSYPNAPVADSGLVLVGTPCPFIQFDFGESVRIPLFKLNVQGPKTLGWCFLLCSQFTATSTADAVQSGDQNAGFFTVAQMNSNTALETLAKTQAIRGRYWRFCFFKTPPAD